MVTKPLRNPASRFGTNLAAGKKGINYFEKRELIEIGLAAMHPVAPVGVRASRGSASAA
jgi:hypothetical protein